MGEIIQEKNEIVPASAESVDSIQQKNIKLQKAIQTTDNKDELEALYQEFNINNTKREVFRVSQMQDLLDKINEQATERFIKRPDEISNKEMIDYMNAVQNQLTRSQKVIDGVKDINAVQVNNNQTNTVNLNINGVETSELNKESRKKITDTIKEILNCTNSPVIDVIPQETETEPIDNTVNKDDDEFSGDE